MGALLLLAVAAVLALPGAAAAEARLSVTVEGGGTVTSADGVIACPPTCSFSSGASRILTLTATPDSRSAFGGWDGCDGGVTGNICVVNAVSAPDSFVCPPGGGCHFVPNTAQYAVTARFIRAHRRLTVTIAGMGAGSVFGDGGIDCGSSCAGQFLDGVAVSLSHVSAVGSVFAGWSGACSGTAACALTLTGGDAHVTATFVPEPALWAGRLRPGRALAGRPLAVRLPFQQQGDVTAPTVVCHARVVRRLVVVRATIAGGTAVCVWWVPRRTSGKVVRGSVILRAGVLTDARSFAIRIR